MLKLIFHEINNSKRDYLIALATAFIFSLLADRHIFFSNSSSMEGIIFITNALAPRYISRGPQYQSFLNLPISANRIAAWRVLMPLAMALIFFPSYFLCRLAIGAELNLEIIGRDLLTVAFVCLINGIYFLYRDLKTILASQIFALAISIAVPLIAVVSIFTLILGQVHSPFAFILIGTAITIAVNSATIFLYLKRKSYIQ